MSLFHMVLKGFLAAWKLVRDGIGYVYENGTNLGLLVALQDRIVTVPQSM